MKVLGRAYARNLPVHRRGQTIAGNSPLGIGGKEDPVRLVFDYASRPSDSMPPMIDMGSRFRLIVNTVEAVPPGCATAKPAGGAGDVDAAS